MICISERLDKDNIERIHKLAECGDSDASLFLGDYYCNQNDLESILQSYKWFEIASKQNIAYAMLMCGWICNLKGLISFHHKEYKKAFESFSVSIEWAEKALHYLEKEEHQFDLCNKEIANSLKNNSTYNAGCCHYELKKYDLAAHYFGLADIENAKTMYRASLLMIQKDREQK